MSGLFNKLSHYEVLVLDDLGYVQQSREELEALFSLLSERYERGNVELNLPNYRVEQAKKRLRLHPRRLARR